MGKRKYTKLKGIESEILEMKAKGKTNREIAEHFELEKEQIKGVVKRYNRKQAKQGLPREQNKITQKEEKRNIEYYKRENKRLEMENELMKDFLRLTGRK